MFIDTLKTNYLVTSFLLKILFFVATSISTFTRNPSAFDPISFTDHSVEKDLFFFAENFAKVTARQKGAKRERERGIPSTRI